MNDSALVCSVDSGLMPKKLYAVAAEFPNPAALYEAAEKVRDHGFCWWDCYTPYAIHGLDKAMGLKKSWVPVLTLIGGIHGIVIGFLLITITSVYIYPIDTQGKPYFSLPAFVPILDLLTIMLAAIFTLKGIIVLSLLPRLHHPLWEWDLFSRATHDKFFVVIEARDPRFDEKATVSLLQEIGGTSLTFIGEEE
jgi:Protein of unknown function (DUF3341)